MTNKNENPYADILRAIADGKEVQYFYAGEWKDFPIKSILGLVDGLRVKSRTIRIGDYDVPEPVSEKLRNGDRYFVTDPSDEKLAGQSFWGDDEMDLMWLARGLIHLDEESAILHAKALISLTEKK